MELDEEDGKLVAKFVGTLTVLATSSFCFSITKWLLKVNFKVLDGNSPTYCKIYCTESTEVKSGSKVPNKHKMASM